MFQLNILRKHQKTFGFLVGIEVEHWLKIGETEGRELWVGYIAEKQ